MANQLPFVTKYRPKTWDDFIGNEDIIKSVRTALDNNTSKSFLFTGDSGFGKTTLARIAAKHLKTQENNIIEIDGATYTGIDNMREITEGLKFKPLGKGTNKVIIIDECHALSRPAIQSLLKIIEEPPNWIHWFLCTTNISRVPETIQTRCSVYTLKSLDTKQLRQLLDKVVKQEGVEISSGIIDLCVKEAYGSARRALANLSQTINCQTREEAFRAIGRLAEEDKPVALARALMNHEKSWLKIKAILNDLKDENPESIRHIVRDYITKVVLSEQTDGTKAFNLIPILDEFSQPFNSTDGITPVIIATARCISSK